jgi:hypothetical protein
MGLRGQPGPMTGPPISAGQFERTGPRAAQDRHPQRLVGRPPEIVQRVCEGAGRR